MSEKQYWLMVLQRRKETLMYKRKDFEGAKLIREMQELIEQNKVKDYSVLEDFGIDVQMDIPGGRFVAR